jgi:outer membrane murein-binding lipoprotein Lpp
MNKYRLVPFIVAATLVSGCATLNKSECREADWQTIGLEDAAKGHPLTYIGNHRKACAEYGVKPDLDQYRAGHQVGLARFCTPDNGFKQGRAGRGYNNVCPVELEGQFLAGYDTGRELHELKSEIDHKLRDAQTAKTEKAQLEKKLQNIENLLVSGVMSAHDRKTLLDEFKDMQTRHATLEVHITDLELGAARMQGEYDVLNSSHSYY